MAVERGDVEHVATLARLAFTEEELVAFTSEMNGILALFEELREVDTDGVRAGLSCSASEERLPRRRAGGDAPAR